MIDIIAKYIEQSPYEQSLKKDSSNRTGDITITFNGEVVGRAQSLDLNHLQSISETNRNGRTYNPEMFFDTVRRINEGITIEVPTFPNLETTSSIFGMSESQIERAIEEERERAAERMRTLAQEYIGQPNNRFTTARMQLDLERALEPIGSITDVSFDLDAVTFNMEYSQESDNDYERIGIRPGVSGSFTKSASNLVDNMMQLGSPSLEQPMTRIGLGERCSCVTQITPEMASGVSIKYLFEENIEPTVFASRMYRDNDIEIDYEVSYDSEYNLIRVRYDLSLIPLERPEHAGNGLIQPDIGEVYKDTLDDQEKAWLETKEYEQRTRSGNRDRLKDFEVSPGVYDIIGLYNMRYSEKKGNSDRGYATLPVMFRHEPVTEPVTEPEDIYHSLLDTVSRAAARALDEEILNAINREYTEEEMIAMPLTITQTIPFTVDFRYEREPIYALGFNTPIETVRGRRIMIADSENMTGFLSLGDAMAKPLGSLLKEEEWYRMGRDGGIYVYNEETKRSRRTTLSINMFEWRAKLITGDTWFTVEHSNGSSTSRIVDVV